MAISWQGGEIGGVEQEFASISSVMDYLVRRSGKNLRQVADETGIPYQTLYNIRSRASSRTSLRTLKTIADYFGEDISIFLGLRDYEQPFQITWREREFLNGFRRLSDAAQRRIEEAVEDALANEKNLR